MNNSPASSRSTTAREQAARLGLEEHIEVIARIEAEHEKRLMRVYRI
jgi:hypothetical protein